MTRPEEAVQAAESQMGCPYVYGTWGQLCTVSLRKRYASYNPSQKANTYKRCQRLRDSNQKSSCDGCKYEGKLAFDCRGFTHWVLDKVGIDITGQSVGTQWAGDNWDEKGDIALIPDLVCCVFIKQGGKLKHTGLHVGGGRIIHCSVEVKEDHLGGERNWTHYAVPRGLYTAEEIKAAHKGAFMRTMRKGMQGDDVRSMQGMLIKLGYSCGSKGADGVFGAKTEDAVRAFQKANGLTDDGIAGPATLELLAAKAADPTKPEPEQPGEDIVLVRRSEISDMLAKIDTMNDWLDEMAYKVRGWTE